MTFAEKFHNVVSELEADIEAEPGLCLSCNRPYKAHSMQEQLRSESDPPGTWYTEYGERCPGNDCFYVDPDTWVDE